MMQCFPFSRVEPLQVSHGSLRLHCNLVMQERIPQPCAARTVCCIAMEFSLSQEILASRILARWRDEAEGVPRRGGRTSRILAR
eukprot:1574626-Rhodomonas_salina.1